MPSAENSISEPPNLKVFLGRIPTDPPTRLVPSALARAPPLYKRPSYGPVCALLLVTLHLAARKRRLSTVIRFGGDYITD